VSEVDQILAAAEGRVAELTAALTQRDARITQLENAVSQAAAEGHAQGAAGQPTEVVSIDSYDIETLGIGDESNVRKLKKAGYTTIGQVRQGFANLKDLKLKGGQKAVIDIAERLMGKVPASTGTGPAPAAATTQAEGTPEGHTDRSWLDRLGAVKAKERDVRDEEAKIAAIKAQYPDENNMPDAAYDQLLDKQREKDMAKAQVVALVWGLGLDKGPLSQGGSVDDCLTAAGLTHLCEDPAPRAMPAAAAGQ
jgi:hypothetical protein